jgi:hypothetical protein
MRIPAISRGLLSVLASRFPGVDPERVWRRLDLEAPHPAEQPLEKRLAQALRPYRRVIGGVTLIGFTCCVWAVYSGGVHLFTQLRSAGLSGPALLVPLAGGVLIHGLFAVVVHEATHGNVLGHPADEWLGNVALGLMLMPFAAETYQHFHRVHHRIVLREGDPNWTRFRQRLFQRSRLLYVLYELLPIVNNLDRVRDRAPRDLRRVALSWAAAIALVAWLRPPAAYLALVFVGLNTTNALRLWTEHFGFWRGQISNLYYCPLSLGAGNHGLHHRDPKIPALALAIGLLVRQRDGSMLSAPYHVLFSKDYRPFRTFQPDFTGDNP